MLTLESLCTNPFGADARRLREKFESSLPPNRKGELARISTVVQLATRIHTRESPLLGEVIRCALEERPCHIEYERRGQVESYSGQFFSVTSGFGQSYAIAWDFKRSTPKVFRCDRLRAVEPLKEFEGQPVESFVMPSRQLWRKEEAIDFEVMVTQGGADLFHKEPYPSIELGEQGGSYVIRGFYNPGEERFIADYVIRLGDTVTAIKPAVLLHIIQERIDELAGHFSGM